MHYRGDIFCHAHTIVEKLEGEATQLFGDPKFYTYHIRRYTFDTAFTLMIVHSTLTFTVAHRHSALISIITQPQHFNPSPFLPSTPLFSSAGMTFSTRRLG
jgi:hypothetical protein